MQLWIELWRLYWETDSQVNVDNVVHDCFLALVGIANLFSWKVSMFTYTPRSVILLQICTTTSSGGF